MGFLKKLNQARKGISKGAEKKQQEDLKRRAELFIAEYKLLVAKFKMDMTTELEFSINGIRPVIKLIEVKDPINLDNGAGKEAPKK